MTNTDVLLEVCLQNREGSMVIAISRLQYEQRVQHQIVEGMVIHSFGEHAHTFQPGKTIYYQLQDEDIIYQERNNALMRGVLREGNADDE